MKAEAVVVLAQTLLVVATLQEGYNYPAGQGLQGSGAGGQYPSAPAQYSFHWDVSDPSSSNYYGHQEERDNDYTQGRYYVLLPDSRRLIIEYFVDSTGFHPSVSYEGSAQFPAGQGQGASYSPPSSGIIQIPSQSYVLPEQ